MADGTSTSREATPSSREVYWSQGSESAGASSYESEEAGEKAREGSEQGSRTDEAVGDENENEKDSVTDEQPPPPPVNGVSIETEAADNLTHNSTSTGKEASPVPSITSQSSTSSSKPHSQPSENSVAVNGETTDSIPKVESDV